MTPDIAPDYEALLSEAEALTAGLTVWPWPAAAEARLADLAQAAGWPASAAAQPP
ncbi:MAG: hypothetical protein JNK29_05305, partial [Anaerolineales bacterium]|nr:hypothetical protein [Anaerolineales bacterium]